MQENLKGWQKYLSNATEEALTEKIEFMSAWEINPSKRVIRIDDAIIHLINHSSYHRGQIVQLIKGYVDALPLSTYIMYASEIVE
jgi:uncharacterized damage-inducible protein DinB